MNRNEDRFVVAVMSHNDIVGHVHSVNNGASSSILCEVTGNPQY